MASIKDVAEKAGVSESTVSRALSGKIPVNPGTRRKVMLAVKELGYRPNLLAQSLRSHKSQTLALLLPDITAPVFSAITYAAELAAHNHGYSLMLCNTLEDVEREAQYLSVVGQRWVDGVIMSRVQDQDAVLGVWKRLRIPLVVIDRAFDEEVTPSVVVDNERVGMLATEHLINLGHRTIACVTGPLKYRYARERLRGYQRALEAKGLKFDGSLVVEGGVEAERSHTDAVSLLTARPDISAFYAFSDIRAVYCIKAIRENGLRVPSDISVVGTNNNTICDLVDPPLTTVSQPFEQMATQAVDMVVRLAEGKRLRASHVVLEPELVVRETTALAPGKAPAGTPLNGRWKESHDRVRQDF